MDITEGSITQVGNAGADATLPAAGLSRRRFAKILGLGAIGVALPWNQMRAAAAEAGVSIDDWTLVPEDKEIPQSWLDELTVRGSGSVLTGDGLAWMGMPVGGLAAGQVYLGGDGQLWHWDVDNQTQGTGAGAFVNPYAPSSRFASSVVLRTTDKSGTSTRFINKDGFSSIEFRGRYPIGAVNYADPTCPLAVELAAYSPFAPLDTEGSSRPVTVLEYELTNTSSSAVQAEIGVYSENPVALASRRNRPLQLVSDAFSSDHVAGVQFSVAELPPTPPERPDQILADFEDGTYQGWTSIGEAFGETPIAVADLPTYVGGINATGQYVAFSHNTRLLSDQDSGGRDNLTGTLTSPVVTLTRHGIRVRVGGGTYAGHTCVNVKIDDVVVASTTGAGNNQMVDRTMDVREWEGQQAVIEIVDSQQGSYAYVSVDSVVQTDLLNIDVVFEDWETGTYDGWTVEGTAFGARPVQVSEIPSYQGNVNAVGQWCVNSHASAPGSSIEEKDGATGKLISDPFTIDHNFLAFRIGGGNHPGETGLQLVVGGTVVAEVNGQNNNMMSDAFLGMFQWKGQQAQIVILDTYVGSWGNVGIDQLVFTNSVGSTAPLKDTTDNGTFAIALEAPALPNGKPDPGKSIAHKARMRPSIAAWSEPAEVLDSPDAATTTDSLGGQAGAVSVAITVPPNQTRTVRLYYGWYFPVTTGLEFLQGGSPHRRHYSTVYTSAADAVTRTQATIEPSAAAIKLWCQTFYEDSTLPWWFLERTFSTVSILASSTCHRLADGRFYSWEGVQCCAGTCTHVWAYAQAAARVFPELERDTRERVDLGIGMHADTGQIGNRAEADMGWAADGEAGTILRFYREHQMCPDNSWLDGLWPKIRKAVEWMIAHDNPLDGLLDGGQPNTLDAVWYGHISWISSLYIASLRAGQAMASDVGDTAFADYCGSLADSGTTKLDTELYNGNWYIHKSDPAHLDTIQTTNGVEIDQVMGQSWAHQLALPRISDAAKTKSALNSLWRYNFTPAPIDYRNNSPIQGGRTYYDADSHALLMCTWPAGGEDLVSDDWTVGYFNEAMNGFEYQVAGHMLYEGRKDPELVKRGMLITRSIHDRYRADRRNPYNEIECGDHYARSMASYGVYNAALGFEYHGPQGHLGFAPRIQADNFAAAFITAAGWGRYSQTQDRSRQNSSIEIRSGTLTLRTLRLDPPGTNAPNVTVIVSGPRGAAPGHFQCPSTREDDGRLLITFAEPVTLGAGQTLRIRL